jgi:hypothetical protein
MQIRQSLIYVIVEELYVELVGKVRSVSRSSSLVLIGMPMSTWRRRAGLCSPGQIRNCVIRQLNSPPDSGGSGA